VDGAMELIAKHKPQLIFLDIQMPNKDGFALLKELRDSEINSEVVFVTAFDQFTMQALKNHAFGYLMKPVVREELLECIHEFKARKLKPDVTARLGRFLEDYESSRKIRFNTRSGFFQVDPAGILYCQAEGNYTSINTGEREQICTLSIGKVQEMLPQNGYLRIGRSLIINKQYISKVDRKASEVTFEKAGKAFTLPLSTRQIKEVDKLV
jgi:two-component system, LytTR family, response regulator